jgi:hypothetical protein
LALAITLIITAIGLLLGLVPSILIQRPAKEKIFYWVGQVIAFIAFYLYFIPSLAPQVNKEKTNVQENEATIVSLTHDGQEYFVRIVIDHQATLKGFDIDKYDNSEYMRVYKKQEVLKAKLDKFDKAVN